MAIGDLSPSILWGTELHGGLTEYSGEIVSPRRGRRSGLSDDQLNARRDQFVEIFENVWAEIWWDLQRCRRADDLVRIFTPIADPKTWSQEPLSIFLRSSSEAASAFTLSRIRVGLRATVEALYAAIDAKRLADENLRKVNWALDQARGSSRRMVKRARKKRRKEAAKAQQQHLAVLTKEKELRLRLSDLEASFARNELFRFLKSKRYGLTPLSLASAAAGLPYMGWRQSIRRTAKFPSIFVNRTTHQVFKAIRYLTTASNRKTANALVASFRERIPQLPSRHQDAKNQLAVNWFYLERAIRQACGTKPHPRALHCEIAKRYSKLTRSHAPVDEVLADLAKIDLRKRPKTRAEQARRSDASPVDAVT